MKKQDEGAESAQEGTSAPTPLGSDEKEVDPSASDFHPIKIKGEPLSATIRRDRRERPY